MHMADSAIIVEDPSPQTHQVSPPSRLEPLYHNPSYQSSLYSWPEFVHIFRKPKTSTAFSSSSMPNTGYNPPPHPPTHPAAPHTTVCRHSRIQIKDPFPLAAVPLPAQAGRTLPPLPTNLTADSDRVAVAAPAKTVGHLPVGGGGGQRQLQPLPRLSAAMTMGESAAEQAGQVGDSVEVVRGERKGERG